MRANRFPVIVSLALAVALGCATAAPTDESRDPTAPRGPLATPGSGTHPRVEETARAESLPGALFDPAAQLPAPEVEYRGATALGLALRRLGPTHRILMIGAHPDDENTAILAELALGRGADVAYLSLTRGEGGQNLIGGELEEALGLIRTEELLAARRLDGAVQFFSRAYDFGFSRSADETFRHWPRDSVLADVVAVIRRWRPDVVISQFTGTPRDGHGHHQAAGILAREAYVAAADPSRFRGQLDAGLAPHQPTRFYQSWYRTPDADSLVVLETGWLDPLLGRSRYQIAMASRSRHRSQDMGRAESAGPQSSTLSAVAPGPALDPSDIFEGIDATLPARARAIAESDVPAPLVELLERYERQATAARETFRPALGMAATAAPLLDAVSTLDSAYTAAGALPTDAARVLRFHVAAERGDASRAALLALGVVLDVTADRPSVSPGDTVTLELALWNGGSTDLRVSRLEPDLPDGWWAETEDAPVRSVPAGQVARRSFRIHLPLDAPVDVPYFLEQPRPADSDLYVWPDDPGLRARPFQPPLLRGSALVAGALVVEDAAEHVEVDPAQGELREPLLVLPGVSIDAEPDVVVLPLDAAGRPLVRPRFDQSLRVNSRARGPVRVGWRLPPGWDALTIRESAASAPIESGTASGLAHAVGDARVMVELDLPERVTPGDYRLRLGARDALAEAAPGYALVDYPHIRPRLVPEPDDVLVRAFPVAVPSGVRIAYVPGSGDDAPAAIAALGLTVDTLAADAIASTDLSVFDVILTGARAYEVSPELASPAARARFESFVRGGGALIVQYNKYDFADHDMALLPLTMSRPHDRVTDEAAPVRLLDPSHPLLSRPNRIGAADFEGWVQERGLYFAHTWDDAYTPLLEMADPGRTPLRGSLLAARIGRGWYVYTGLALFRQLPAGVPGAYRLLANLLALGAD